MRAELLETELRSIEVLYPHGVPVPTRKRHRKQCVCGVELDELNPDCHNCDSRHSMRKTSLRRRARSRLAA